MFDGLDCLDILSDLAAVNNVDDEIVREIYKAISVPEPAYQQSRIKVCVDLLRSLGKPAEE